MSEPLPEGSRDAATAEPRAPDVPAPAPEAAGDAAPRRHPWRRRWLLRGALLVGLVLLALYSPRLWYLWNHESTDDAFVTADTIVPIVPQVTGRVARVAVEENQSVAVGDLLVEIENRDYRARLDQAKALVGQREAALERARLDLERTRPLVRTHVASQEQLDQVQAAQREAAAALDEARAALELARIDLERTEIRAPVAGSITKKNVSLGQVVSPGDALFALVDLGSLWVVANFKETQIDDMRVGQPVDIEVDAYPGQVARGHVQSFQPGTGSVFSLLPPENASGNFVKVVQRVPVRIAIDSPPDPEHPLYPGLSVVPYVDTRVRPEGEAAAPGPAAAAP